MVPTKEVGGSCESVPPAEGDARPSREVGGLNPTVAGKNKKAPGGASLRARLLGGEKGRHPAKGCSKGLEKTPEDGNCCDTIPEAQAESGCRLTLMKREWGLPVVPVPGSRTQTHSEERYSLLYHEGSNQRATPFSTLLPFPSHAPAPRGRRRPAFLPVRPERSDDSGVSTGPGQLVDVKRPGNRTRESRRI